MIKSYCDKCKKEMPRYTNTTVDIRWGFWNGIQPFSLCKSCDQTFRNLVQEFLDAD
jgi:hypothetical protein